MATHDLVKTSISRSIPAEAVPEHRVLRDTYRLLSATLLFSAFVAFLSVGLPAPGLIVTLGGYFGLLFLVTRFRNSYWGLAAVFGLTGFMGYTLGPLLGVYMKLAAGPQLVATAMGVTAVAFVGLSLFARSNNAPDMLKYGNFIFVGILVAFGLSLAAYFVELPALALAVSGLFVLLMCGWIMYETQNIVRGGETKYIMATVGLFVAIFNLFTSLLQILGLFGQEEG